MNETLGIGLGIFMILIAITGAIGYVMNIIKVFGLDFCELTGVMVIRIIGILMPPLGAVVGYIQ